MIRSSLKNFAKSDVWIRFFGIPQKIVLCGILALAGLFIARSRATVLTAEDLGLGIFLLSVGYGLFLVKRYFDEVLSE